MRRASIIVLFGLLLIGMAICQSENINKTEDETQKPEKKKVEAPKSAVYVLFVFLVIAIVFFIYNVIRCQRSGIPSTPRIERQRIVKDETHKSLDEF